MLSSDSQWKLRQIFKYANKGMVMLWRLGLGSWINLWPSVSGRIMVITHQGRKSGRSYRTPVNYAIVNGQIYCTAGFGPSSDWYRNIMAHPQVEVWLPDGRWEGVAEDASEAEDALAHLRQVLIASGFAAHAVGIHPQTMTEEELASAVASYRLVRIRRVSQIG